jgi:hypothetical protein
MQASKANGFMNTSITDCSGTPFNFQPEYNTAAKGNIVPWAALETNISTEYETGHFEPCQSISDPAINTFEPPSIGDTYWNSAPVRTRMAHRPMERATTPRTTIPRAIPPGTRTGR